MVKENSEILLLETLFFLLVPFNKVPSVSKDFITFIISFVSLFVRVIPETLLDFFLFDVHFSLSSFIPLLTYYSVTFSANSGTAFFTYVAHVFTPLFNASVKNNTCAIVGSKSARTPTDSIILDNCVFENFILADEPFVKALWILEIWVLVDNNLHGKRFHH